MGTRKPTLEDLERITELAKRWGKIIVKEHWGEHGPGLDVNLDQMEQVAVAAVRGLLAGTLETAAEQQAGDECGSGVVDRGGERPGAGHGEVLEPPGGRGSHLAGACSDAQRR